MRPADALRRAALAAAALLAAPLAACGGSGEAARADGSGRLEIATTVAPITSIVSSVGGDRVRITGIVPEGTDSHTFEPRPSVAQRLSEVDVLFANGLVLEEPTKELADQSLRDGAEVVELGTRSIPERDYAYDASFPESGGKPNPHLWTDPKYAIRYSEIVRDELSDRAPADAPAFAANQRRFAATVGELDRAMRTSLATVAPSRRKLLTYHDAYAYFARSYGWRVIGAIQLADFGDPTPREVASLIEQVRRERVPAIFGSEVFPSPVLEQIGREAGVRYVDVLRDDDLPGEPGDPEHSWASLMRFDYITITEALGGEATALRAFRPRDAGRDRAEYPQ